jgi:putative peptidoglycan lipid II flippase
MGTALVSVALLAVLSPVLGRLLVPGLPADARGTAAASLAILAVAAYAQIAAATLAATLAGVRRFVASAVLYIGASLTTLLVSTALLAVIGIVGAALGVLAGSAVLLAGHHAYLARFGLHARPRPSAVREPATWRMTALASAGAAIPLAQQLALTIALAAVSREVGAVTAYTYAYFVGALLAGVTINAVAFVMVPRVIADLERGGEEAAVGQLTVVVPVGMYLLLPLAAAYAAFGLPLLDAVFGRSLGDEAIGVLWDASRLFLLMNVAMVLLTPASAIVLALRRYRALVLPSLAMLAVHATGVALAAASGAVAVASVHAAVGAALTLPVLAIGLRGHVARAVARGLVRSLPAVGLALIFPALAVVVRDPGWIAAAGLALAGLAAYFAVGTVAGPAVGGRTVRMLRGGA